MKRRATFCRVALASLLALAPACRSPDADAERAARAGRWEESLERFRVLAAEHPGEDRYQTRVLELCEQRARDAESRGDWSRALALWMESVDQARSFARPVDVARFESDLNLCHARHVAAQQARGDAVGAYEALLAWQTAFPQERELRRLELDLRGPAVLALEARLVDAVRAGEWTAAADACRLFDRIDPRHRAALQYRKRVWERVLELSRSVGNLEAADEAARKLIRFDPSHSAAREFLERGEK
ncbi:MAG: hypothetical protein ACKVX7_14040 [Planctomycetota bacterium]